MFSPDTCNHILKEVLILAVKYSQEYIQFSTVHVSRAFFTDINNIVNKVKVCV
jgi:hypothetical protein